MDAEPPPSIALSEPPPADASSDARPTGGDLEISMDRISAFFSSEEAQQQLKGAMSKPRHAAPADGQAGTVEMECNAAVQDLNETDDVGAGGVEARRLPSSACPKAVAPRLAVEPGSDQVGINAGAASGVAGAPASVPQSSAGSQSSSSWQAKESSYRLRLGMPRNTAQASSSSSDAHQTDMRYLQVTEKSRQQFQQYAKDLTTILKVECADSNPYVKALSAHREELLKSQLDLDVENCADSLPARLATQRFDSLATLKPKFSDVRGGRSTIGQTLFGCGSKGCGEERHPDLELLVQLRQGLDDRDHSCSTTAGSERSKDVREAKPMFQADMEKGPEDQLNTIAYPIAADAGEDPIRADAT